MDPFPSPPSAPWSSSSSSCPAPPDPRVSHPLLTGLSRRPSAPAAVVREALAEYRASLVLARWARRRRGGNESAATHHHRVLPTPTHWLLRRLVSDPAARVRRAAGRILLEGAPSSGRGEEAALYRTMLRACADASLRTRPTPSGGDPAVQCFGLLERCLTTGRGATTAESSGSSNNNNNNSNGGEGEEGAAVKESGKEDNNTTTNNNTNSNNNTTTPVGSRKRKRGSSSKSVADKRKGAGKRAAAETASTVDVAARDGVDPVERFLVAEGGLRWIAARLLALSRAGGASAARLRRDHRADRAALLVHAAHRARAAAWTSTAPAATVNGVALTPLACLVAARESDRAEGRPVRGSGGGGRPRDALARWVDWRRDAAHPAARRRDATTTTAAAAEEPRRKRRRTETGRSPSARATATEETTATVPPPPPPPPDPPAEPPPPPALSFTFRKDEDEVEEHERSEDEEEDDDDDEEEEEEEEEEDDDDDDDEDEEEEEDDDDEEVEEEEGLIVLDEEEEDDDDDDDDDEEHHHLRHHHPSTSEHSNPYHSDEDEDGHTDHDPDGAASSSSAAAILERRLAYVGAAVDVLSAQHPPPSNARYRELLSPEAERSLLASLRDAVKPPPRPDTSKVFLRRAPTQEEFFRGALSRNPVTLSAVSAVNPDAGPTFADLRKHIADDLQMSDSAELLELLVAGRIVAPDVRVADVRRSLRRRPAGGGPSSSSSSSSPAMIVTYRLAGVDGEATEEIVERVEEEEAADDARGTAADDAAVARLAAGRGAAVLLRCARRDAARVARRTRRDGRRAAAEEGPSPALVLLRRCADVAEHRRRLVRDRAPTILLRSLLDVLKATEDADADRNADAAPGDHPTARSLRELVEVLARDMGEERGDDHDDDDDEKHEEEEDDDDDVALLLDSLKDARPDPKVRSVIANLLPFLARGRESRVRALAAEFSKHALVDDDDDPLARTFRDAVVDLPPGVAACDALRSELVRVGTVGKLVVAALVGAPAAPPPWSPALRTDGTDDRRRAKDDGRAADEWRAYLGRPGLRRSLRTLVGLSNRHAPAQNEVARSERLLETCHWIENASDKTAGMDLRGVGLLAETLLDTLLEHNDDVEARVKTLRDATRRRKREIADERRSRALVGISRSTKTPARRSSTGSGTPSSTAGSRFANMLNSSFERLAAAMNTGASNTNTTTTTTTNTAKTNDDDDDDVAKPRLAAAANNNPQPPQPTTPAAPPVPSWLAEMEAMEDETGLTCAVCQEGRTLQPTELLGLYVYVKKVTIPHNKGGSKNSVDGTNLLLSLPDALPERFQNTDVDRLLFRPARLAAAALGPAAAASRDGRPGHFVTTVTAGNAIHHTCHARARRADRAHPKAPKSEWEGASLRNSRVECNAVLPLLGDHDDAVPLSAVESGLADHQSAVSNVLGGRPRSMLWTVLHDVRLLLLRVSYNEPLNADCGGGSLTSNAALIFRSLAAADTFARHADHDAPHAARHARRLDAAALVVAEAGLDEDDPALRRAAADAAPAAAVGAVLFGEPERRSWSRYRRRWATALLRHAGRRAACGVEDSGCVSAAGATRAGRGRRAADGWESRRGRSRSRREEPDNATTSATTEAKDDDDDDDDRVEDHFDALRPLLTFFLILDRVSTRFRPNMDDETVAESAEALVPMITRWHKAKTVQELVRETGLQMTNETVLREFERGRKPF